jgi:hypothetical protein
LERVKKFEKAVHFEADRLQRYDQKKALDGIRNTQAQILQQVKDASTKQIDRLRSGLTGKVNELWSKIMGQSPAVATKLVEGPVEGKNKVRDETYLQGKDDRSQSLGAGPLDGAEEG